MCDPISITGLVLSVASSAAGYMQASQQAQAQAEYQNALMAENTRVTNMNQAAAQREFVEQSAAERMNQMQESAAANQQAQAVQKATLQKQGQMLASTNASGMALDYLMADYAREESNQKDVIRQQYEFISDNADTSVRAHRERAQVRLDSQERFIAAPVKGPSFLGTALEIGAAGVGAWDKYQTNKYKKKTAGTGIGGGS